MELLSGSGGKTGFLVNFQPYAMACPMIEAAFVSRPLDNASGYGVAFRPGFTGPDGFSCLKLGFEHQLVHVFLLAGHLSHSYGTGHV